MGGHARRRPAKPRRVRRPEPNPRARIWPPTCTGGNPTPRSDDELIDRIGAREKLKAWAEASQLAEIAELAARRRHSDQLERADHAARGGQGEPAQLMEFLADEIALATRISRVAANNRLDLAQDLTGRLLAVFAALQAGTIDLLRAVVADAVLVKAPAQTPARYGPRSPGRCTSSTRPGPRNDTRPTSPTGGSPSPPPRTG